MKRYQHQYTLIDKKNTKLGLVLGKVFLAAAVVCGIVMAYNFYKTGILLLKGESTQAEVVDVKVNTRSNKGERYFDYTPEVSFQAEDGRSYTIRGHKNSLNVSSATQLSEAFDLQGTPYHKGQMVAVLYMPQKPEFALINDYHNKWSDGTVFGFAFMLLGLLGGGLYKASAKKIALADWLLQYGKAVDATVTRVIERKKKKSKTYRLAAEWVDEFTQQKHEFKSDMLQRDPEEKLRDKKTVTVVFDPKDPKRHLIDIGFLLDKKTL